MRTLGRMYCTLTDERRAWQQRIHAPLVHQGCPPIRARLSAAGRDALARAELSAAGRRYVDTALRRIDELSAEIEPLRTQLINFARRQAGCRALQARHYGVGWLCAPQPISGLFDTQDLAEIAHPDYPDERLIACRNPALAAERARKRHDLLQATEKQFTRIAERVSRGTLHGLAKNIVGNAEGLEEARAPLDCFHQTFIGNDDDGVNATDKL